MTDSHRRARKYALHIFLIITLGTVVYSGTLHVPFYFDDARQIVKNHLIKDLNSFINLPDVREREIYADFAARIVTYFTFALNYAMHGLSVEGYHIVNIAIHIINAILVYGFVIISFKTPFLCTRDPGLQTHLIALFSALIFVSHPVQTQAVTYIVQRLTSLATMFYLLSIVLYIQWRLSRKQRAEDKEQQAKHSAPGALLYAGSLISVILAMKSKEIAFTLPLVITLYEFMFFQGNVRKRLLFLVPILLTLVIIPYSFLTNAESIEGVKDLDYELSGRGEVSRTDYLMTQFRVIVTYLRLLVLPINQNLDYDYPVFNSFLDPNVYLSFLFLLSIFLLGVYLYHRSRSSEPALRLIAFGIFWFFITLSVESSIIPLTLIFEHRLYLPSVGAFVAFATSIFFISDKFKSRRPLLIKTLIVILFCTVMIFSAATYKRNILWTDPVTFWKDVIAKSQGKKLQHVNLGNAYRETGRIDEAIQQYLMAIQINPNAVEAYNNLGNVYILKGRIDEAIEQYRIALELVPDYIDTYNNLGNAYALKGKIDEAIKLYRVVINMDSNHEDAHLNLGLLYLKKDLLNEARSEFAFLLKINPYNRNALMFLQYLEKMKKN